jgi:hypothetical protein
VINDTTYIAKFQVDSIFHWEIWTDEVIFLAIVAVWSCSTSTSTKKSTTTSLTSTSTIVVISSTVIVSFIGGFYLVEYLYTSLIPYVKIKFQCFVIRSFADVEPLSVFQIMWKLLYIMSSQTLAYVTIFMSLYSMCIYCFWWLIIEATHFLRISFTA